MEVQVWVTHGYIDPAGMVGRGFARDIEIGGTSAL